MTIYTASQIRSWDAYTIQHEPIASIDLMERAAQKCTDWLLSHYVLQGQPFKVICGKGNNGGDGLAIARMLYQKGGTVDVFILEFGKLGSDDFQTNLQLLHELPIPIHFIQSAEHFPRVQKGDILIDALFGSGLNKPLEGLTAELVNYLNASNREIVAIDFPSGLFADKSSKGQTIIKAQHTLSFQTYKTAFLIAENAVYTGQIHILDIGLHQGFNAITESTMNLVDASFIKNIYQPRNAFAHKGNFGHALLIGGSYGKIGALVLAAMACLKTGAGLTTTFSPSCGYEILQTSIPEAMAMTDSEKDYLSELPKEVEKFSAIGVGPGIGTHEKTQGMLLQLLSSYGKPMVIDADGLNCLAKNPDSLQHLPHNSILTPHPKEFERLFGTTGNDFDRMQLALEKAKGLKVCIVLKGHHTLVAAPDGRAYFNSTGNPGMAKGGSGDVLTGIIAALLAQGYSSEKAAILGVYLHGLAGDFAAEALSKEAMIASDIVTFLSQAFLQLSRWKEETE